VVTNKQYMGRAGESSHILASIKVIFS